MVKAPTRAGTRYREIADRLEGSLRGGAYQPGQRLPSVRMLCRNWRASITTVVAAYHLLEQRGLVEARAQSGHYAKPPASAPEPEMQRSRLVPSAVDLGQLALMVMKDSLDARLVPFGPALPDPALLPTTELHRLIAQVGRDRTSGVDRYGIPPGLRALRDVIARRAAAFGCAIGPDQVVITAGALEALTLALRATCRAGQTVAIESPMYYGLLQSIEALGLRVIEIPTHPRLGMSLAALREAMEEHPISAVVAMPGGGNPLGGIESDAAKQELVALLAEQDIPLIEDDVLGDLCHHAGRSRPAKAHDRSGLVLWCSSLSKTAAPGLRVGWISAGRYQGVVEHLQFTNAVGPSPLTQDIAARFLVGGGYDRCLRRARTAYAERTAAMGAAVLRWFPEGTRVSQPMGGFCLWVEMPLGVDAQQVYAAALRIGISITPGPLFSPKLRYRHFIRLSAARWRDADADSVRKLGDVVTHLARPTRVGPRARDPRRPDMPSHSVKRPS
jgi:DNA-binding transcriptional MocR family regulator